ncbi:MAG: tRNA preQ1(34) S-adenosylmethionine ribosyltransferase-isomerase QueA [Acidobacteriota bacterium]|nr:tRNA preQ1(34) S-adenosylmethionine ribosyltransferase-isomerase QueA [Acidobacteriota bacterium]MDQ3420422.1 tRNA preQ1(34) S-adenosylmethionine ribosyltransferase-isomerase QueA [Acidobacteriota bacterium]
MLVSDFDFELPEDLIAQEAAPRGASRLMVVPRNGNSVQDAVVADLPRLLEPGDLLVVNNTKVFAARLLGRREPSGGAVECLLLRRVEDDVWEALMHPGQKLKPGARVIFEGAAGVLHGEVLERRFFGRRTIRLATDAPAGGVDVLVDALGHMPLPPYIKRDDTAADRDRYQTVFAARRGSVAAPTAGLHFNREILAALDARGVERQEVTLHVGYGTFKPVRVTEVEAHEVDPEPYEISTSAAQAINAALAERRRIIAVGTTTTRCLEDAAARGDGQLLPGAAEATTFIYPGFQFRVIGGLVTNFHLPQSSLLVLVSAFAGRERVLAAYREAVARRYRFYSYGDAMVVL